MGLCSSFLSFSPPKNPFPQFHKYFRFTAQISFHSWDVLENLEAQDGVPVLCLQLCRFGGVLCAGLAVQGAGSCWGCPGAVGGSPGLCSLPWPRHWPQLGLRPCPELTGCVHCPENTLTPGPASLCPWESDPVSLRSLVMTFCGSPSSLGERTLTSK